MTDFNLYREAKDNYGKLIPNKKEGLILLSLYSKYKEKNFTEENIISVVNDVYKDHGRTENKEYFERNNNLILKFQESFLWRDKSTKTYHFKKYALDFCINVENRLKENYNPAKIKRWFDELYNSLILSTKEGKDFGLWIEDNFDVRKPLIANQIEILDQQVNNSVSDFKSNIKSESKNILQILEQIELDLEVIKNQALELRNAFQISYDIDNVLTSILEKPNADKNVENIRRVRAFHDKSRSHLEHVSNRIEKIKPRIREFIYNFNRKDLDRKTDKLLSFLLRESKVVRKESSKEIVFPFDISLPILKNKEILPKYNVIPLREFAPKPPIIVTSRVINKKDQKKLINKTLKWKKEKDRVNYWTKLAFLKIDSGEKFQFAPFFYDVLKKDDFNIGVKTANRILKKSIKEQGKYNVTINKSLHDYSNHNNVFIWKMNIEKK